MWDCSVIKAIACISVSQAEIIASAIDKFFITNVIVGVTPSSNSGVVLWIRHGCTRQEWRTLIDGINEDLKKNGERSLGDSLF